MNRIFKYIALAASVLSAASCATPKQILYFQDIDDVQLSKLENAYEAVIKKDDRLSIVVSGPDKSVTAPYNLTLGEIVSRNGSSSGGSQNPENSTLTYLVDPQGEITFPILGRIKVEGMTRSQLVDYLTAEIGKDVKDPIVYVSIKNYKITVLGEVGHPGTFNVDSEKINVLQALGMAGDLTLNAKRNDAILLREVDGEMVHYKIDLRDSHTLDSESFYLQQNDVLYIPPSANRVAAATTATGVWSLFFSSITTLIAILSLILI